MSAPFPHFIIIDDSQLDCFIAEKIIQNTGTFSSIKSFTQATDALESIKNSGKTNDPVTIIILDIQMPLMNGFQFVEAFEQLPKKFSRVMLFSFSVLLLMKMTRTEWEITP